MVADCRYNLCAKKDFHDEKLDIGDHEVVGEPELGAVAEAAGKALQEV